MFLSLCFFIVSCSKETKNDTKTFSKKLQIRNTDGNEVEIEVFSLDENKILSLNSSDFILKTGTQPHGVASDIVNEAGIAESTNLILDDPSNIRLHVSKLSFNENVTRFFVYPITSNELTRWRGSNWLFSTTADPIYGWDTGNYTETDNSCSMEFVINKCSGNINNPTVGQEMVGSHIFNSNTGQIGYFTGSNVGLHYMFRWDEDGYGCSQSEIKLDNVIPHEGFGWLVF